MRVPFQTQTRRRVTESGNNAKKSVTRPILVPCLSGEPASVTQYRQPRVTRNRELSNLWPHAASKVPLCYGGVSFRKVSAKRKASCRRRDQAWVSISHTVSAPVRIRLWKLHALPDQYSLNESRSWTRHRLRLSNCLPRRFCVRRPIAACSSLGPPAILERQTN